MVPVLGSFSLMSVAPEHQFLSLAFNLDYYTEVLDLSYLLDHLASDPFFRHYRQLNEKLVQLIEDYSLVSFIPLNIQVRGTKRPLPLPLGSDCASDFIKLRVQEALRAQTVVFVLSPTIIQFPLVSFS